MGEAASSAEYPWPPVVDFAAETGAGVLGKVEGRKVRLRLAARTEWRGTHLRPQVVIGNRDYMNRNVVAWNDEVERLMVGIENKGHIGEDRSPARSASVAASL